MKLYFMKQSALDFLKVNMKRLYVNYYQSDNNDWIEAELGYDPFVYFSDVPDFSLAEIDDRTPGEINLENCKIVYENLRLLSESQASDERLWAGLCNGVFYKYMRRRYNYTRSELKDPEKDANAILSRFFFLSGKRSGAYRNILAKSWWVGHATYNPKADNHFEMLDDLGANDFSSKVSDIFYSNTFASNPVITAGIFAALKYFTDRGIKLNHRDHIRASIQYLNAVGGALLLDSLSTEEIEKIMIGRITELLHGNAGPIVVENPPIETDDEDEGEIDTETAMEEPEEPPKVPDLEDFASDEVALDKPEYVSYGCLVTVAREKDGKEIQYSIPLKSDTSRDLYPIEKRLLGKQVGFRMYQSGSWYEILECEWDE